MIKKTKEYKDDFILNIKISDIKFNQIPDAITEIETLVLGQLDDGTWIHYNTIPS